MDYRNTGAPFEEAAVAQPSTLLALRALTADGSTFKLFLLFSDTAGSKSFKILYYNNLYRESKFQV